METKKNKLSDIVLINNLGDYLRSGINRYVIDSSPVQITVKNDTNKEVKRTIFGASDYNENSLKGIQSSLSNISYKLILRNLLSKTIYVNKIRVMSANSEAAIKIITLGDKSICGQEITIPIITQNYFSAFQIQKGIVDIDFEVKIDVNTYFDVTIPAKTVVSYMFFQSKILEFTSKFLSGSRGSFITTCSELIRSSDYILKKYRENPYLHSSDSMIPDLDKIHNKIYQWVNDKTFEYSFHKNLIEIYNTLNPFVSKYKQLVDDAEPLLLEYRKSNYEDYLADEAKANKKVAKNKTKKKTKKAAKNTSTKLKK